MLGTNGLRYVSIPLAQTGDSFGTCLPEDKVVGAEQLAKWTSTNTVHGACDVARKNISINVVQHEVAKDGVANVQM